MKKEGLFDEITGLSSEWDDSTEEETTRHVSPSLLTRRRSSVASLRHRTLICHCWRAFFGAHFFFISTRDQYNARILQAAKDVREGQDALVGVFERIESYFQRLEIYTETTGMMDTNIQIIVAILSILGIVTKGIK